VYGPRDRFGLVSNSLLQMECLRGMCCSTVLLQDSIVRRLNISFAIHN
jgi:hypothetical protein